MSETHTPTHRLLFLALVPLFVTTSPVQAESIWLSGAEAGRSSQYLYLGNVQPLGQSHLGQGWVQRYWLDGIRYEYESGKRTIRAKGAGMEAAIGYQTSGQDGWLAAYAGLRWNHTRLSPNDRGNDNRGSHLRPRLQLEGDTALTGPWRFNGITSYTFGQKAHWTRLRLGHRPHDITWGMEYVHQGDPSYHASQIGLYTDGWRVGQNLRMGLKAGVRRSDGDNGPYVGVEFFLPLD